MENLELPHREIGALQMGKASKPGCRAAPATLLAAALGAALTACTTVTTTTPAGERVARTPEEFSAYVEQVFRYENRVGSDLIDHYELAEAAGSHPRADLLAAEERMIESCRYLHEVIISHLEGRVPDLALKMKLVDTIADCEYAARDVSRLIGVAGQSVVLESATAP